MKSENEKVKNGKAILDQIQAMQSEYEASQVDEQEEEMEFIDRLNQLMRAILGDQSFSVYKNISKESIETWHKARFRRFVQTVNLQKILYFLLLVTITGFLVSEALPFYALSGVITTKVYIKAILTEVCFIFLSGYIADTRSGKAWVGLLRAGIFCLMLFVITSETFTVGAGKIGNTNAVTEQIQILEKQITEKEKTIQFYMDKGWGVNVRQHTFDKNKLVDELLDLKKQQAKGANILVTEVEKYKTYGRAFFRVLLLLISALITRRLFKF